MGDVECFHDPMVSFQVNRISFCNRNPIRLTDLANPTVYISPLLRHCLSQPNRGASYQLPASWISINCLLSQKWALTRTHNTCVSRILVSWEFFCNNVLRLNLGNSTRLCRLNQR